MSSKQAYANDLEIAYFGWDETLSANNIRNFSPKENTLIYKQTDIKSIINKVILNLILISLSLLLMLEELEWMIFSRARNISEQPIDETDWNINNVLEKIYKVT